jgi:hypothetical protein
MSPSSISRRDALVASAGLVVAAAAPSSASAQSAGLKDIDPGVSVSPEDAAEIWSVLDKYIANYRMPVQDYIDKHLETLLFPHVRIASHQVLVLPEAAVRSSSCNSSNCFGPRLASRLYIPVRLPDGRLKLWTRPISTGSAPVTNTNGVVLVAAFAANDAGASKVTSTATLRLNSSPASNDKRLY